MSTASDDLMGSASTGTSVTFLTQYFYPEVAASAQLLTDLTLQLHQAGYKVSVFTGQPSYWKRSKLPPRETYRGVTIRRFFSPGLPKQRTAGRLTNMAIVAILMAPRLLFGKKPDVVLADSTSPFLGIVAWLLHALRRCPYVFLVEDVYPDLAIKLGYVRANGLIARLWNRLNRWIYGSASRVVVLGSRMRDLVVRKLPSDANPDKVVVIHNWADGDVVIPRVKEQNWFCQQHGLTDSFVILYSGNLGEYHDLETVVEAAGQLRNVPTIRFVVIGDGAKREKLANMVHEMQLDNLLLLPYQPREALPYSLTCGDVSVVTLEPGVEGICVPSKLYSSLAAGQAILALLGEGSEVSDIVEQHRCGVRVPPGDVAALVKAVTRLHNDPGLLLDMKRRARACFEAGFTRSHAVNAYLQVFRQAINHTLT